MYMILFGKIWPLICLIIQPFILVLKYQYVLFKYFFPIKKKTMVFGFTFAFSISFTKRDNLNDLLMFPHVSTMFYKGKQLH